MMDAPLAQGDDLSFGSEPPSPARLQGALAEDLARLKQELFESRLEALQSKLQAAQAETRAAEAVADALRAEARASEAERDAVYAATAGDTRLPPRASSTNRRDSGMHSPMPPTPEPAAARVQPALQKTLPDFPFKLVQKDGRTPDYGTLDRLEQEHSLFHSKWNVSVPYMTIADEALRTTLTNLYPEEVTNMTLYTIPNARVLEILRETGAPLTLEESRKLLRAVPFHLDRAYSHNFGSVPSFTVSFTVYAKTFLRLAESINRHAKPSAVPPFTVHGKKKHVDSITPIFLEVFKEKCQPLHAFLEEQLAEKKHDNVSDMVLWTTNAMTARLKHFQSDEAQQLLRSILGPDLGGLASPSVPALPARQPEGQSQRHLHHQADIRTPHRPEQRPFRLHALHPPEPVTDNQAEVTEHPGQVAEYAQGRVDSLAEQQDEPEHLADEYDERDYDPDLLLLYSDEAPMGVPALKYHSLSFHATSAVQAGDKGHASMPCFKKFRTGECGDTNCPYGHSRELMRARWLSEYEALKRNPYSDIPVPGGRAAGGAGGQPGRNVATTPYPTARNARPPDGPRYKST